VLGVAHDDQVAATWSRPAPDEQPVAWLNYRPHAGVFDAEALEGQHPGVD
jgi:hypothetical protein